MTGRQHRRRWPARIVGAAATAAGVWVLANTERFRIAEAWSTAVLVDHTVGRGTRHLAGSPTLFVGLETPNGVGLRIDQLCSSSAVTGAMLVLTGLLLAFAGLHVRRALLAVTVMVGLVAAVNAVRLTVLSWSITRWGLNGWFEWLHLYGGAAISMVAIAAGLGLYLRLLRRGTVTPVARTT